MRPKLKSDTFYIPVDEGVYVRNNEHAFVMKGRTLASWMERLVPLLDGTHELDALCQNLPTEKQAMLNRLVDLLVQHGCVRDTSLDHPHTLSQKIQHIYAPAITFLEYHADSGPYRLQQFLSWPVLAVGSGDALVALAHALLETGNRQIHLLDSGEQRTDYQRIAELLVLLQAERDAELALHTHLLSDWLSEASLEKQLESFKMVLCFSEGDSGDLINRLAALCFNAGVIFLPALVEDSEIIIGPVQHPGVAGCWRCYQRRRLEARGVSSKDERETISSGHAVSSPSLSITATALVANLLAFECFKQGTDTHIATLEKLVQIIELESLASATHQVFAHPACPLCAFPYAASHEQLRAEIMVLQERDTSQEIRQLARYAEQWTDLTSGIFTRIAERDFLQLPLIRSEITVASPSTPSLPVAIAAGSGYREVREQAAERAIALYLERQVDARRLHTFTLEGCGTRFRGLLPQHFAGWNELTLPTDQPIAWLWAWQLDEQCTRLVPAAAAYPRSDWNRYQEKYLFQPEMPGVGVGTTWPAALASALLALSQFIDHPAHMTEPVHCLDHVSYTADPDCAAYLTMLEIMKYTVALVDRTGASGLPCVEVYLNKRYASVAAHWHTPVAVREALKAAVLAAQIEQFPAPDDLPIVSKRPAISGPVEMIDCPGAPLPPSLLEEEADYPHAVQILQERLSNKGWRFLVVPLTVDSTLTTVVGCALRVLAIRQPEN